MSKKSKPPAPPEDTEPKQTGAAPEEDVHHDESRRDAFDPDVAEKLKPTEKKEGGEE